ncbi:MAG: SUMF1/EgtB/PvdO family nonheme iron enzyme [Treponema sp.]|jgi:formylglycine-generating enzyme required for sulfatase activity|nr:SUMF1/EgtB/PvdO family nonheme iron enzyme [Treponema sp.]
MKCGVCGKRVTGAQTAICEVCGTAVLPAPLLSEADIKQYQRTCAIGKAAWEHVLRLREEAEKLALDIENMKGVSKRLTQEVIEKKTEAERLIKDAEDRKAASEHLKKEINSRKDEYADLEQKIKQAQQELSTLRAQVKEESKRKLAAPQAAPTQQPPVNFVYVEGGTFSMGSTNGDDDEKPVHTVTVKGFYMSKYEVTQKEWAEVMGNNPSYFKGDNLPVENVSWYDAIEYCNRRSVNEGLTPAYTMDKTRGDPNNRSQYDTVKWVVTWNRGANGYRLPTEAEWEYAAKGGCKDYPVYEYSGSNNVASVGWYYGTSGGSTHPVGTKTPNSLGLYDMSGNVWEWCWDWYGDYTGGAQTDPVGASSGSYRLLRGGSWDYTAQYARSAGRNCDAPSYRYDLLGFRLVRP